MKNYNITDLDPRHAFTRHVFHRDQFAHYLRWSHILKVARMNETFVDFGCGRGNLAEVLYRNLYRPKRYVGLDIRPTIIKMAKEKFVDVKWPEFYVQDIIFPTMDYSKFKADRVVSFEVIEHVGKQNADTFMRNFIKCGKPDADYYISTPNYDENMGAAANHVYDAGDGRGKDVQEFTYAELEKLFSKHMEIKKVYGTFASQRDYSHLLVGWKKEMFLAMQEYYGNHILSAIMAPLFPAHSRNTLWVLKRKKIDL